MCTAVAPYTGPSGQTRQARQPPARQTEEGVPAEYPGHTADPQDAVQFHAILHRYKLYDLELGDGRLEKKNKKWLENVFDLIDKINVFALNQGTNSFL